MTDFPFLRLAGRSAYLSVVVFFASLAFFIGFFSAGQPYGTLNDLASALLALLMVPVALALYRLFRPGARGLSLAATGIGLLGMATVAVLQTLLVFGVVRFEQTLGPVLTAQGLIGVWLLLAGYLTRITRALSSGVTWPGFAAGAGYVALAPGFWLGGQQNPLFILGSLVVLVGYPIWAIRLGRALTSGGRLGGLIPANQHAR
jgi:hypothetical protein